MEITVICSLEQRHEAKRILAQLCTTIQKEYITPEGIVVDALISPEKVIAFLCQYSGKASYCEPVDTLTLRL